LKDNLAKNNFSKFHYEIIGTKKILINEIWVQTFFSSHTLKKKLYPQKLKSKEIEDANLSFRSLKKVGSTHIHITWASKHPLVQIKQPKINFYSFSKANESQKTKLGGKLPLFC